VKACVSSLLFTKLNSAVPKSWKKIRHIIESYSTTQDGYGALCSIMTNNSGYLRILRNMWGPQWTTNMGSSITTNLLCLMFNATAPTAAPTLHTPTSATPPTPAQSNAPNRSLTYEDCFLLCKETGQRMRDVLKKALEKRQHLPKNAKGKEMCLSYHVKGICNFRCRRKADHRTHNATETQALLKWCKAAFDG
jgi:hypothetical protein